MQFNNRTVGFVSRHNETFIGEFVIFEFSINLLIQMYAQMLAGVINIDKN